MELLFLTNFITFDPIINESKQFYLIGIEKD